MRLGGGGVGLRTTMKDIINIYDDVVFSLDIIELNNY